MLCFDYCVKTHTHVNLLLFTAGGRQEVTLTDWRGGADNLGRIAGGTADGRWHHARVDLAAALRYRRRTIVRRIGFADLGPGSSTTADAYRIDNWTILPAVNGARAVAFRWTAADESGISGYAAVLDREAATVPAAKVTTAAPRLTSSAGLAEGLWYLHVRARDGAGNWGPAAHWPFKVVHYDDRKAPKVASVSPAADVAACPRRIEAVLSEEGSGISAHDVELRVGGLVFRPGDEGVTYYPGQKKVSVSLVGFDGKLRVPAGEVRCTLRAADYAGNRMADHKWTWKLDLAKDPAAPRAPRVIYLPSDRLVFQDFESGQGTFSNWRRGMTYRQRARRPGGAGAGRWYASTNGRRLHDNNNETQLWPTPFDPARYSYLAFDYRMSRGTSFDFLLQINNLHHTVGFGPYGAGWSRRLGRLTEGRADGNWHRAEVDLRKIPARLPKLPDGRPAPIQKILSVSRTQAGADLDNFVLASPYGRDPAFLWEAPASASGVSGYSWLLDSKPDSVPPEKKTSAQPRAAFKGVKPGTHYFHVRALSGAGRWGGTAHRRIVIEKDPDR
jgi:hypothetical protein